MNINWMPLKRRLQMAAVLLPCTLFPAVGASAEAPAAEGPGDLVLVGDAVCTRCHEETEGGPSLLIGKNRHGTMADPRAPTCTSCHGVSDTHVNKPEGVDERPFAEFFDQRDRTTPVAELNRVCLDCHQGGARIHWQGSLHEARDVACVSCHKLHAQHDPVRERLTQAEVCMNCHKEKRAQISKIARHPTLEGKVICSDCHNPHGSAGRALVARDTVNDTCFQCHAEKRGPFLWNHQPVTEDCSICHNPHGSTVANLLKWRSPMLCQQCHEPSGHRDVAPAITPSGGFINGRVVTVARGCLNCHTNIHGSNNPLHNQGSGSNGRPRAFIY